jgi:ABC-2 type transport system ATP-binding protein
VIQTTNLTKHYGDFEALRGIDLLAEPGDIYGFIGPNGAGKTTTIKILTTLLEPTGGDASIDGRSVWDDKDAVRSMVGYMPDSFGVYPDMTVTEYLHFFAAAYDIPRSERMGLCGGLLELTDLSFKEDALVDSLSKGMQQRLGLARALVHDPKVLIMDEPAAGLDPRARVELREILRELQSMGKTILLSSHILSELAEVCNRVGIVERGKLVAQGAVDEILEKLSGEVCILVRTTDDAAALIAFAESSVIAEATRLADDPDTLRVRLTDGKTDVAVISELLATRAIGLRHLERERITLENAFMQLTRGLVQ